MYDATQLAFGANRSRQRLARDYLRVQPGWCVLDIGCGTGQILDHLPERITYYGFDLSAEYITAAQQRYNRPGVQFEHADVSEFLSRGQVPPANLVLATGVLHHLDDEPAADLIAVAAAALLPGGRFVSVDPTFAAGQSRSSRLLVSRDRGQSVRTPEGYRALAATRFRNVTVHVRHDMLRIPYSHVIMECVSE